MPRGPALRAGAIALIAAFPLAAQPVAPQPGSEPLATGVPQSAVVVLDRDALFSQSLFGLRAARDIEAASRDLAADNRRIETALEAEEKALTARRGGMETGEFRELAAAFDKRVTGIRDVQDAKARAISQQGDRAQQVFFEKANPVLVALAQETGALVILDRRSVIASADQIDITLLARTRIDAVLGEGDGVRPAPRPLTVEDTAATGTPSPQVPNEPQVPDPASGD